MATIEGTASAEIEAPIDAVYAIVADIEGSPRWQPDLTLAECLERDRDGNQTLMRVETDAKVRRLGATIRVDYEPPNRIEWAQEDGDLKSFAGAWELEDLGAGRTRATYRLDIDPGRVLGMAVRGPVVEMLRERLIDSTPEKLKGFAEGGSA